MSDEKGSLINIELIPKELIVNTLGPATKSIGEGLGGIVNYVMGPLRRLNVTSEKSYQDFVNKINTKTESIPDENRDTSKFGLALKTMEDSRYQIEEEDMREYFANLLAGLIDNRKNSNASPRFSTILSELTTTDAYLLSKIYLNPVLPTVSLRVEKRDGNGITLVNDLILFDPLNPDSANPTIETLQSYGLIEIRPQIGLTSEKNIDIYNQFERSQFYKSITESIEERYKQDPLFKDTEFDIRCIRGSIKITALGQQFCSMIFSNEDE
ncbi:DUF4393 domain-containing protein [Enterococcus faecium]|uniref:DUF4393 domain-containing protein n=1 Tax=Enterococcus faecium TaxID=1352 RepID=UPI0019FA2C63|nr:DUF4393 domain-containing protein [Enterococcus faecium]EKZ0100472.1 DUF4393 domain-containing protein [Enterococcus faecium]